MNYIDSAEFHGPMMYAEICAEMPDEAAWLAAKASTKVPKHAAEYAELYRWPLLTREQERHLFRHTKVRMNLDDLFLDESGATLARWAEEDRLDRSPAAPRKKLDKPLVNSIDPWDGLENQELPKDPILRKRMQERIRTRRRLQKMTNKQREEYYAKRKVIRDRSRIKKQPQEVQA
jgi:hypothetical protein